MMKFGVLAGKYHVCLGCRVMIDSNLDRVLLHWRSVSSYQPLGSAAEDCEISGIDNIFWIGHLDWLCLIQQFDQLS